MRARADQRCRHSCNPVPSPLEGGVIPLTKHDQDVEPSRQAGVDEVALRKVTALIEDLCEVSHWTARSAAEEALATFRRLGVEGI